MWDSFVSAPDLVDALIAIFISNQSGETVAALPPPRKKSPIKRTSQSCSISRASAASAIRRLRSRSSSVQSSHGSGSDAHRVMWSLSMDEAEPISEKTTMPKRLRSSDNRRSSSMVSCRSGVGARIGTSALPEEPLEVMATDKNALFQTLSLMLAWADSFKDRTKEFKRMHRLDKELTETYCSVGNKGLKQLGDFAEDTPGAKPRKRKFFKDDLLRVL